MRPLKITITNRTYNIELKQGNLFEPVKDEKFDFNLIQYPPTLPTEEDEKFDDEINARLGRWSRR